MAVSEEGWDGEGVVIVGSCSGKGCGPIVEAARLKG